MSSKAFRAPKLGLQGHSLLFMLQKAVDGQFYSLVRHINTKSDLKASDYMTLLYFSMCMYVYTHTKINSGNVATCKMLIESHKNV